MRVRVRSERKRKRAATGKMTEEQRCGTEHTEPNMKTKAEAMTGPFKWELVNAMKEYGFSISISRTLGTHEIITGHKHWSRLCTTGKSSSQANCGQGVGATWAETAREQGMPDDEWKTVAREGRRAPLVNSFLRSCHTSYRGIQREEVLAWPPTMRGFSQTFHVLLACTVENWEHTGRYPVNQILLGSESQRWE